MAKNMIVFLLLIFMICCTTPEAKLILDKKDNKQSEKNTGKIKIGFNNNRIDLRLDLENIKKIFVTIKKLNTNETIYDLKELILYNMNGEYITEQLSLNTGAYQITQFFVADNDNNILYAAPVENSPKASFVNDPLPMDFIIEKDQTTNVLVQVVEVEEGSTPEDFGYVTFSFEIVDSTLSDVPTNLKKLTTNGPDIVEYESGDNITLKGVAFTGGVWSHPFGTPDDVKYTTTEWDFQNVKSWGANAVTFYMDYYWFTTEAGYEHMDEILDWARKHDIYIIPHITVYPIGGHRGGYAFFYNDDAKAQLKNFWYNFAERYKNREEIAGYCIMDEPHAYPEIPINDTGFQNMLKSYMEEIIDDIRTIDNITPVYIECIYGSPDYFIQIDRDNIVYNIHFYQPMGYTAAGYPWIAGGGVPLDVSYPGYCYQYIYNDRQNNSQTLHYPVIQSGTNDWQMYEIETEVPDTGWPSMDENDKYLAFINVFSNGDRNAVIYIDDIEYEINSGGYNSIYNGSFEIPVDYDQSTPLTWIKYDNNGQNGNVTRTNASAKDGSYSLCFTNCSGWTHYENIDYWINSAGAIEVAPGQTLKIKFWVKTINATENLNGIQIKWATGYREYINESRLQQFINNLIINRRSTLNKPFFIGEFTPSMASKRPDSMNYLTDLLEYFNACSLHWTYYVYRENWTNPDRLLLGIYNDNAGIPAQECRFTDDEVINILKNFY